MARLENAFSEGAALGVLMCGRDSIPRDKVRVEMAFRRAWRAWPYSSRFPFVSSNRRADEFYQLTHADYRKHTFGLFWDGCTVVSRNEYDDEVDFGFIANLVDEEIPAEAWRQLMQDFFDNYER
ncbi:hypothetical protein [Luteococcus peritonei]|uniref:Uncharacterized protein n=1 Tax=Luteococcus peritonei TaxID=88874 RepID=A0ABW4RVG3_9ACTN